MPDTLPPEVSERLANAWPRLSAPARALLLWLVDVLTAPDARFDARLQEMAARAQAEAQLLTCHHLALLFDKG